MRQFYAPGLTGHYARVINRRPHIAQFNRNELTGCSCGKTLDSDEAYKSHLKGLSMS